MLYLGDDDHPLERDKARELLAQDPTILRHTRAWVDDSQLCLEVECRCRGGAIVIVKMNYCWDAPQFREYYYFIDITEWLLNNDWASFNEFVQKRFTEVLTEHATNPHYSE